MQISHLYHPHYKNIFNFLWGWRRESKGEMGEKKRGQTAYTLISPGITVPGSLKV